ncbi:hypothetical protein BASA83_011249 [Batrachochytrium salamandrivorans]|nr:hypothetical protein BASA83_011249 [Batrachochytrium salamandrivorans]
MLARSILPLIAFFTAPVGTKINSGIDVTLDSEPGRDFLYLSAKSSGGVEDFLIRSKSLDGKKMLNGSSLEGKGVSRELFPSPQVRRFSVSLKFTSKWATAFAGATINSLNCLLLLRYFDWFNLVQL